MMNYLFSILLTALVACHAHAESIYASAGEKECWAVSQTEVEAQTPTSEITISDGNKIKINGNAPLIFLYSYARELTSKDLDDIKSRLLNHTLAPIFPEGKIDQKQNFELAFDYWNWVSTVVLRGSSVRPNFMISGDIQLFQPRGGSETKAEYVEKVTSNLNHCKAGDCYRADLRMSPHLQPKFRSDFGVGRPVDLQLPGPVSEIQYAIYKNKVIGFKITWKARLNEKYQPKVTDKSRYSGC